MKKILFLDFDGVLFDTVDEAYYVCLNTQYCKSKRYPEHSLDIFRKYRTLVGPAWNYFYVMDAIENGFDLSNNSMFILTDEAKHFEEDFFATRREIKKNDYKLWLKLNKKYYFLERLEELQNELNLYIYIITTKDKQTVKDLLEEFKIDFLKEEFILGKDIFTQLGSKRNMLLYILEKEHGQAIFIDDLYEHLKPCKNIENLMLVQAEWGYVDENNRSSYLSNVDNTIKIIEEFTKGLRMNVLELEMLEILRVLKNQYGVIEIKAEFEAEGSRIEELMRLKDVTSSVGLPIILKIGGAEAVTDIYNGIILGVEGMIAPMVETSYAVSKYLGVIDNLIQPDNRDMIDFAINIETITAVENIEKIMELDNLHLLSSVTFGRSDFVQSMGLAKSEVNSKIVYENVHKVATLVKQKGFKFAMGGNITKHSIEFIQKLYKEDLITKYETRKVVFDSSFIEKSPEDGIELALRFELLWLKSKKRFYSKIKEEDDQRIADLEKRLN